MAARAGGRRGEAGGGGGGTGGPGDRLQEIFFLLCFPETYTRPLFLASQTPFYGKSQRHQLSIVILILFSLAASTTKSIEQAAAGWEDRVAARVVKTRASRVRVSTRNRRRLGVCHAEGYVVQKDVPSCSGYVSCISLLAAVCRAAVRRAVVCVQRCTCGS